MVVLLSLVLILSLLANVAAILTIQAQKQRLRVIEKTIDDIVKKAGILYG